MDTQILETVETVSSIDPDKLYKILEDILYSINFLNNQIYLFLVCTALFFICLCFYIILRRFS